MSKLLAEPPRLNAKRRQLRCTVDGVWGLSACARRRTMEDDSFSAICNTRMAIALAIIVCSVMRQSHPGR